MSGSGAGAGTDLAHATRADAGGDAVASAHAGIEWRDTRVNLHVYKNKRSSSAVKHTGVLFFLGHPHPTEAYRIDFGPSDGGGLKGMCGSSAGSTPVDATAEGVVWSRVHDGPAFLEAVESHVHAASFDLPTPYWRELSPYAVPDEAYNVVSYNCRSFCKTVLRNLAGAGVDVSRAAFDFIEGIETRDVAVAGIGIGVVVGGLAALLAYIFRGPPSDDAKSKSEEARPAASGGSDPGR